ncbi:MAG: transglycosylase SLT domain-containing protein [Candidatus Thiodiazotropha taylori]|nr:transglycosylase SLT domain-containing protein [Candidatus Thiodiazotropha taylori]
MRIQTRTTHFIRTVTTALAALTLLTANPLQAAPDKLNNMKRIVSEAEASNVPPSLALAIARVGSSFRSGALGQMGERGVMQLHPEQISPLLEIDTPAPWEPDANIRLGVERIKQLMGIYHDRWDLLVSHYQGVSTIDKVKLSRVLPQTRLYVRRVLKWQQHYQDQAQIWTDLPVAIEEDWVPPYHRPTFVGNDFGPGQGYSTWRIRNSRNNPPLRLRWAKENLDDFGDRWSY